MVRASKGKGLGQSNGARGRGKGDRMRQPGTRSGRDQDVTTQRPPVSLPKQTRADGATQKPDELSSERMRDNARRKEERKIERRAKVDDKAAKRLKDVSQEPTPPCIQKFGAKYITPIYARLGGLTSSRSERDAFQAMAPEGQRRQLDKMMQDPWFQEDDTARRAFQARWNNGDVTEIRAGLDLLITDAQQRSDQLTMNIYSSQITVPMTPDESEEHNGSAKHGSQRDEQIAGQLNGAYWSGGSSGEASERPRRLTKNAGEPRKPVKKARTVKLIDLKKPAQVTPEPALVEPVDTDRAGTSKIQRFGSGLGACLGESCSP